MITDAEYATEQMVCAWCGVEPGTSCHVYGMPNREVPGCHPSRMRAWLEAGRPTVGLQDLSGDLSGSLMEKVEFYRSAEPGSAILLLVVSPEGAVHVEGVDRTETVSFASETHLAWRLLGVLTDAKIFKAEKED